MIDGVALLKKGIENFLSQQKQVNGQAVVDYFCAPLSDEKPKELLGSFFLTIIIGIEVYIPIIFDTD